VTFFIDWDAVASLFGVVFFGSVIPIVPTGAAVSAAAVVAAHHNVASLIGVVVTGTISAYIGDAVTYALCRWGGTGAARRLPWLRETGRPARTAERLTARPVSVLLVSRMVPGGRVPVLLAAGVFRVPWRHVALANLAACALWSAVYTALGLAGRALFPEPWQGVVAVIAVVLAISLLSDRLGRRRVVPAGSPQADTARAGSTRGDTTRADAV
jgi:membrane protein DedA with SNARE-associated domain